MKAFTFWLSYFLRSSLEMITVTLGFHHKAIDFSCAPSQREDMVILQSLKPFPLNSTYWNQVRWRRWISVGSNRLLGTKVSPPCPYYFTYWSSKSIAGFPSHNIFLCNITSWSNWGNHGEGGSTWTHSQSMRIRATLLHLQVVKMGWSVKLEQDQHRSK